MANREFVIEAGEDLSNILEMWGETFYGVQIPADWETAGVSFRGGGSPTSMIPIAKSGGDEYTEAVTAGFALNLERNYLAPWRFLQLQSGTSVAGVDQIGVKASKEVFIDATRSLTFTSGVAGTNANDLNITITTGSTDNLSASISGYDLKIILASTTGSKNTAAAIQTAVRALGETGSVDLTLATVAGNTDYGTTPPAGTKASTVITTETGKTLTFTSGVVGIAGNTLHVTIDVAPNDTLAVVKLGNAINISLANATKSKNSAANIQTAVRGLETVGDIDVSAMAVVGNSTYNSNPSIILIGSIKKVPLAGGADAVVEVAASKVLTTEGEKTLTFTSGVTGVASNSITVAIGTAEDDVLAVSKIDNAITVLLAKTTASNNAPGAIQTAVQELGIVGVVDVSEMTVVGNESYIAAPSISATVSATALAGGKDAADAVKGSVTVTPVVGKTLTFTAGVAGVAGNAITITMGVSPTDVLSVTATTKAITILLAKDSPYKNRASVIQDGVRALTPLDGIDVSAFTVVGNVGYNANPPIVIAPPFDYIPLANGANAIDTGVVDGVNLEGGDGCRVKFITR